MGFIQQLLRGLGKWLVRFIPLIGYMQALEQENEKLKFENAGLLSRILEITTGVGLGSPSRSVGAAPLGTPPSIEEPPVTGQKSVETQLRELEEKSKAAYVEKLLKIRSAKDYQRYVETGELPSLANYEASITNDKAASNA